MDILHRPEEYPFISDVVDVGKFFEQSRNFRQKVVEGQDGEVPMSSALLPNQFFAQRMGCNEETVDELAVLCE